MTNGLLLIGIVGERALHATRLAIDVAH